RPGRKTGRPRRGLRFVSSAGEPTMKRATIAGVAFATVLVLLAVAAGYRAFNRHVHPAAATSPAITPSTTPPAAEPHPAAEIQPGFLYGRITTVDGATYEG